MMVSPHKHEILAITTLTTQFFLNWRRLTESQVQKHRQRQWSLGGCVAKSALNPPVRRACGGNQNRQWLPFHQLTHWNHINPQGVTVPSGILYYKWREIHIAALVRQQEQAKAPYRCKKKKRPPGLWTQNRCFSSAYCHFTSPYKTRDRHLIWVLLVASNPGRWASQTT